MAKKYVEQSQIGLTAAEMHSGQQATLQLMVIKLTMAEYTSGFYSGSSNPVESGWENPERTPGRLMRPKTRSVAGIAYHATGNSRLRF